MTDLERQEQNNKLCRKHVADQIRKLARERGLTLCSVADLSGISRGYFERVLACKHAPTIDWLVRVSNTLEVPPSRLLP